MKDSPTNQELEEIVGLKQGGVDDLSPLEKRLRPSSSGKKENEEKEKEDNRRSLITTNEDPPLVIIGCMLLNFWSAVLIIWTNKFVMSHGFEWTSLLTWMHFVASFVGLEICHRFFGLFEVKRVSVIKVGPLVVSFIAFVIFNNLSLHYNTVGVYQLLKVMMTPVVVCLQYILYRVTLTGIQTISLIPICVGVSLATVSSLEVNGMLGLGYGILGIFSTSLYQIWVKTEQKNLDLSPYQLLHNQSFLSIFMLLPLALWSDHELPLCTATLITGSKLLGQGPVAGSHSTWQTNGRALWERVLSSRSTNSDGTVLSTPLDCTQVLSPFYENPWVFPGMLGSCVLAFLVNLSTFLVIGKTSPVSYQVLGHSKLFIVMISAFAIFGDIPNTKNLVGASLAMAGIFWYTYLKL